MKARIRTLRDRDTGKYHYSVYLPEGTIIHNRRSKGNATKVLAEIRAQVICTKYGVEF